MLLEKKEACKIERFQQGGKSYFSLEWKNDGEMTKDKKHQPTNYIKKALSLGYCSYYLPMKFIEEDQFIAYYEDTGYIPLRNYFSDVMRQDRTLLKSVVRLIKELTEGREEAEDFLLATDSIDLSIDRIFVSLEKGKSAIAFLPQGATFLFSERLQCLLRELSKEYPNHGIELILEKLEMELRLRNPGTKGLLRLFSEWERELS